MLDQDKGKQELIEELAEMRRRVSVLETALANQQRDSERLHKTEAQWRSIVANAPVFVALVDRAGTIQLFNRYQPGFSQDNVLGKDVCDFVQPEYHELVRTCVARVFQTGEQTSYDSVGAGPKGVNSWYETHVGPVKMDSQIIGAALVSIDITDRRQAEEALAASEERFRKVFDEGPIGVVLAGLDTRIQHVNRRLCEMLGYSEEEIIALEVAGITHSDDYERDYQLVTKLLRGEIPFYTIEKRYIRKDGQEIWGQMTASLVHDANGKPTSGIAMVEDITKRKLAESVVRQLFDEMEQRVHERTAELREANENLDIFRRFAEDAEEGFGMSDFDGRILYANPMLCRLFGEDKPENAIGKNVSTYYPPEYVQRRRDELIPVLLREGHLHIEQTVLPRHGKTIQTLRSTFLIRDEDGSPFRIAVVISDITERKQAEERLAESEAKYRDLVETTDTGYLILDEEGRVVDANAEYVRLTGHRSLSEIIGRRVEEWTAPHDAQRNALEVEKCLQTGYVRQLEVEYLSPDGRITPIEINAKVSKTKQGLPQHLWVKKRRVARDFLVVSGLDF